MTDRGKGPSGGHAEAEQALLRLLAEARVSALIFDMDGTLVDNMSFHRRAWIEWARGEGVTGTDDEIFGQTHGTLPEIMRRFFPAEIEADAALLIKRGERKEILYREMYRPHLRVLAGLGQLLAAAARRGIPIALATAADHPNILFTLEGLGLLNLFTVRIGAEQVSQGKPHPEVFLLAASALQIEPAACLVFEDSPSGVEAARRAGMRCVVINPTAPVEDYGCTDHVVARGRDYLELARHLSGGSAASSQVQA